MSLRIYETGEGVEVKASDSWFPATVFSPNEESDQKLMIQYIKIDAVDSVPVANVRPAPPKTKRVKFQVGNFIEVFHGSNGWRRGKLVGFCENIRCAVVYRGEEKATSVSFRDVRPCLHWVKGSWISHSADSVILQPEIATKKLQKRKYVDPAETEPMKKKTRVVPLQTVVGKAGSKLEGNKVVSQSIVPKNNDNRVTVQMITSSKYKAGSKAEVRRNGNHNRVPFLAKTEEIERYRKGDRIGGKCVR